MDKKKVLVFGAAGFIGTYLTDLLLSEGYRVVASDIDLAGREHYKKLNVEYVSVDLTNGEEFEKIATVKPDVVINLAALQPANFNASKYKPRDYININVVGTLNILEYCRTNKVEKFIYACSHRNTSGMWVHGKPIKESDGRALEFGGEYAMFSISESTAQDCIEHYRVTFGVNGIIFRLPPVYGFGPHLEIYKNGKQIKTGFQTFIESAMACKPLEMWGDGKAGRDIIYVKDVVQAFLKAIESDKASGLYNITSGVLLTLKNEIDSIARIFWGKDGNPQVVERPEKAFKMDSFVYDNSKANRDFGWSPQYTFEQWLTDYKKEMTSQKFGYLIEKRRQMFKET